MIATAFVVAADHSRQAHDHAYDSGEMFPLARIHFLFLDEIESDQHCMKTRERGTAAISNGNPTRRSLVNE